ncbi:MAG: hypothetical protein Q9174_001183 [Haloplaca sp. 1 TL-2023]
MNRFRSRKKSFHDGSVEPSRRPSTESDVPALPIFSSKTFRRNKKQQPEPKPQIDLATALPSSDDFRTSLLMPNLSKRFSMLREQDDPHSKIGKANDDSVLFPKRASRMDLFNSGGLGGIAEDGSLDKRIRPPFASSRTDSYGSDGSGWMDDDRSVMSRARPGEGNTMFGGRQKIYKIPVGAAGSTKSFGNEDTPPRRGKALYGDDLSASMFPRHVEHDIYGADGSEGHGDSQWRSSDERSNSPPLTKYNRNRGTTSSTNSGPSAGRNSTAATSVASQKSSNGDHGATTAAAQGPSHAVSSDRHGPKSRRLYGQGLDQHMHEQQSSAMHRLESIQRQRNQGAPPLNKLHGSHSATSLNERYQRGGPFYASPEVRAASPPPSAPPPRMGDFDLGLGRDSSEPHVDSGIGRSPPVSPPMSPSQDKTFVAALEPNDLGKATASGAFNKPTKQYSEQQYLQRQFQLQQGRESPSLVRPFSPSAATIDEQVGGRSRNVSHAGPQPNAASLLRERGHFVASNPPMNNNVKNQHPALRTSDGQYNPAMDRSFFSNRSDSEIGSPVDSDNEHDLFPPSVSYRNPVKTSTPLGDHQNGLRSEEAASVQTDSDRYTTGPSEGSISDSRSEVTVTQQGVPGGVPHVISNQMDADSPTLGPTSGLTTTNGLNGLVRAHLRNDSGQSSIYPEPSPALLSKFPNDSHHPAHSRNASRTDASATFFRDSTSVPEGRRDDNESSSNTRAADMPPPLSIRARQILEQATALRDELPKAQQILGQDKAQRVLGGEAPRSSHENPMTWQDQLRAHHTRGGSTETEKERECLANDLAERRRAVQNKLQTFVENESRSSSPAPAPRHEDSNQRRTPFGLLKSKNSKDSLAGKEQSNKAMKMLGIGPNGAPANGSPRPSQDGFARRPDESSFRPQARNQRPQQPDASQSRQPRQGRRPYNSDSRPESLEKDSPPSTSQSSRDRSGSEASERRFGARNVKPRGDALIEEESVGNMPTSPVYQRQRQERSDAPRAMEETMPSMANHQDSRWPPSARARSNSKPGGPEYFGRSDTLPIQANSSYLTASPTTPGYSVHSAPSMHGESPMVMNESIPVMVPPSSSHGAYSSPRHNRYYRKDSINKHDISEPIFNHCTSSVDVVDLPPGASLKNGMDPPPPIPPLNPARRNRTQTLLQALGRLEKSHPIPSSHQTQPITMDPYQERSTFSADEGEHPRKSRHRLKKSSSEGGMNRKARQQAQMQMEMAESPAVPNFPPTMSNQASPIAGRSPYTPSYPEYPPPKQSHHPAYPPQDVPASAVMF